jgi:hypothetical protein
VDVLVLKYKDVSIKKGPHHAYLGMLFDYSAEGEVKVSMPSFVSDMLEDYAVHGTAATPAEVGLFTVGVDDALSPEQAKAFHSRVAKLLYLGKRVRPDILTAVIYLATRVQKPCEEDWKKLERVLKYINGTRQLGLRIKPGPEIKVEAFVDASYAVHADYRSQTGCVISIGGGSVYCKSGKQKLTSKSSTEAELVGLSDSLPQIIWLRNFLIAQGHQLGPARVHQDNKSVLNLVQRGAPASERTRHINIRYFFAKDKVDSKEIELAYLPTEQMVADMLTKPLQGSLFRSLRASLLNWK